MLRSYAKIFCTPRANKPRLIMSFAQFEVDLDLDHNADKHHHHNTTITATHTVSETRTDPRLRRRLVRVDAGQEELQAPTLSLSSSIVPRRRPGAVRGHHRVPHH